MMGGAKPCPPWASLVWAMGAAMWAPGALAEPAAPLGWAEHRDPAGFTLHKPQAWQVLANGAGEIAVSEPGGTAAALVRARSVPARHDLTQWLQQHYAATEPGLHNVRMLRVQGQGPQVAHAAFDYGSNVFQGRASVVAVRHDDVATVFVAAAARAEFVARLPDLTRILNSLRFGGGGTVQLKDPANGETFEASASERCYCRVEGAAQPMASDSDTGFEPVFKTVFKPFIHLDLSRLLRIGTEVSD